MTEVLKEADSPTKSPDIKAENSEHKAKKAKTTYECDKCEYTTSRSHFFIKHMINHEEGGKKVENKNFECEHCDKRFKDIMTLNNHRNLHFGLKPYACDKCEDSFGTKGELNRHVKYKHTLEKPHKCPECEYSTVELSKLRRHMRVHTDERPYLCGFCDYASRDTFKLKRHLRTHTGEKPYECPVCKNCFSQSNSLKAHIKAYHKEVPTVLDETGSPVAPEEETPRTKRKYKLRKLKINQLEKQPSDQNNNLEEENNNSNNESTSSSQANTSFDKKGRKIKKGPSLSSFIITDTKEKNVKKIDDDDLWFTCEQCFMRFLTKELLDEHFVKHTGERPFECEICGIKFSHKFALKAHLLSHDANYNEKLSQTITSGCHLTKSRFRRRSQLSETSQELTNTEFKDDPSSQTNELERKDQEQDEPAENIMTNLNQTEQNLNLSNYEISDNSSSLEEDVKKTLQNILDRVCSSYESDSPILIETIIPNKKSKSKPRTPKTPKTPKSKNSAQPTTPILQPQFQPQTYSLGGPMFLSASPNMLTSPMMLPINSSPIVVMCGSGEAESLMPILAQSGIIIPLNNEIPINNPPKPQPSPVTPIKPTASPSVNILPPPPVKINQSPKINKTPTQLPKSQTSPAVNKLTNIQPKIVPETPQSSTKTTPNTSIRSDESMILKTPEKKPPVRKCASTSKKEELAKHYARNKAIEDSIEKALAELKEKNKERAEEEPKKPTIQFKAGHRKRLIQAVGNSFVIMNSEENLASAKKKLNMSEGADVVDPNTSINTENPPSMDTGEKAQLFNCKNCKRTFETEIKLNCHMRASHKDILKSKKNPNHFETTSFLSHLDATIESGPKKSFTESMESLEKTKESSHNSSMDTSTDQIAGTVTEGGGTLKKHFSDSNLATVSIYDRQSTIDSTEKFTFISKPKRPKKSESMTNIRNKKTHLANESK